MRPHPPSRSAHGLPRLGIRFTMPTPMPDPSPHDPDIEAFLSRWKESGGHERANYQFFLPNRAPATD